jgi:hypothetical protein
MKGWRFPLASLKSNGSDRTKISSLHVVRDRATKVGEEKSNVKSHVMKGNRGGTVQDHLGR